MSSSGPAAEGEGTPAQPASEKEPEMPGPREESEEEDEEEDEEEEEEEEEKEARNRRTLQKSGVVQHCFIRHARGSARFLKGLQTLENPYHSSYLFFMALKAISNLGLFLKSLFLILFLRKILGKAFRPLATSQMHYLVAVKLASLASCLPRVHYSSRDRLLVVAWCEYIVMAVWQEERDTSEPTYLLEQIDLYTLILKPPKKTSKREKPKQKATSKSKKTVKSANVKKADSSTTKKNQNSSKKESESEDSSDDEPLIKKLKKPPTDEELKETVKKLLASANLEEVTMKQICKEVYENYPAYDLTERKDFIKTTVKELIS
nr:protein DEK [Mirounga angustirostris]